MNCANHADASAVAYCRTCGKALCANCTRPVRGVIYCEDCLGTRMEGIPAGTAGFVPGGSSPTTFLPTASGRVPAPAFGTSPGLRGVFHIQANTQVEVMVAIALDASAGLCWGGREDSPITLIDRFHGS